MSLPLDYIVRRGIASPRMKAEMLKGHLDLLLLAALHGSPAHGYAIAETLRARSRDAFDLPEGTLYPALHRLERAGLLVSRWSDASGRRRRVYQLTAKGERALARHQDEWRTFARAVRAVVGTAT
jgi:PadR family transcriptional regulator PadR